MGQRVISLYRTGFHSPQIQMALFFLSLKSSFPRVDTLVCFEKSILCKALSLCKRPSALSLDAGSLFFPSFSHLTSFSSSSLALFRLASFATPSLPLFLSFSLSLPGVSLINRLKPRLFCKQCVVFSVRKTSACFRSWKWTLSSLWVLGGQWGTVLV